MKRMIPFSFALVALALMVALPAWAQTPSGVNEVVTLDDATPSIDVVITLPQDTTGAVSVNVQDASIKLTDWAGNTIFYESDPRIHAVELSIAPNTGSHTLTVERLAGVSQAYVKVNGLAEITNTGAADFVQLDSVSLNQERALPLTAAVPGGSVLVNIPADSPTGVITANYAGVKATSQLVDAAGTVIATAYNDIDGMNVYIDSGDYLLTVVADQLPSGDAVAGVRAMPGNNSGLALVSAPASPEGNNTTTASASSDCTATIDASSVNLRSGPGTGYSILSYGYLDQAFPVGGTNPEHNWIVVGTGSSESAWVARDVTQLTGACDGLTVFNIPFRAAQPAQVVIQPIPAPATTLSSGVGGSSVNSGSGGVPGAYEDEHEEPEDSELEDSGA